MKILKSHNSKIFRFSLLMLSGLMLLGQLTTLAAEIFSSPENLSGQPFQSTGLLDDSYFEHAGDGFAVEIGDKSTQDEQIVKFQAQPNIDQKSTWAQITEFVSGPPEYNLNFSLVDAVDSTNLDNYLKNYEPNPTDGLFDNLLSKFNQSNSILSGNNLNIKDALENIDIKYTTLNNGVKEEIIVNGVGSVYDSYIYELNLDPGIEIKTASNGEFNLPTGTYYFTDQSGNYIAHFLPLVAYDSNGNQTKNITMEIAPVYGQVSNLSLRYIITITVDPAWLTNPSLQYPVTIDPSIVHDTQGEFNNGTSLNRVEVTSDPKVQIRDLPVGSDIRSVGLWHMDETSGTNVADSSGNSSTGTANGSPSIITGKFNNARNFNGSSQYISLANNNTSLKIPGDITIEAWIRKPDSTAGHIVRRDDWANYAFYADSVISAWFYNSTCSGSANMVTGVTNIADNQWHHVVYTKSNNNLNLYVDGRLDKSIRAIDTLACTADSPVHIGAGVSSGDGPDTYFKGDIDEVQIYSSALTPEEVLAQAQLKPYGVYTSEVIDTGTTSPIYDSLSWTELGVQTGDGETDLTTNGLVASWNFNETSGTTASNSAGSCGSQCNATLTGFANTSGQDVDLGEGWTANNKKWGAGAIMMPGDTATYVNNGSSTYSFTGSLTVATWFKADSCGNTNWPHIFQYYSPNYFNMNLDCNQNQYEIAIGTPSGNYSNEYNYDPRRDFGQWQFLVGVFDDANDTVKLYKNGYLLQTVSSVAGTPTWQYFNIGFQQTLSRYFDGTIDTTKVYNRVLDINEINSLYQAGNVQLQTRTGADSTPDDGSWEGWKPSGGGVETQIDNLDNNEANLHVFETAWSNANTNQNWVKKNNATASTTCDSGSACSYTDGRIGMGSSGRGDDANLYGGNVFKDGSTYKMYYYGYDGAVGRIYYTYSSDGLTWTKNDNTIESPSDTTGTNGRLPIGATAGTGDDAGIAYSSVIKDGSTYKMWYGGYDGAKYRIYYATSSDGLTWTKANNAIPTTCDSGSACSYGDGRLGLGTNGKGDDNNIFAPYVFKDGSTYKMYYTGDDGTNRHIFLATSSDGLTWTKVNNALPADSDSISTDGRIPTGTNGTGDDNYLYMGTVIKEGGYYRAWYSGHDGTYWRSYYAISTDGLTWKKINNTIPADSSTIAYNGQIPQGLAASGDDDHTLLPRVIYENGIYKMWYAGEDGAAYRMYHATMTPLPCKNETVTNIKVEGTGSEKLTTGYQMPDSATVGLWHLDETGGTGAYLKDSSGNGNNGTPSGTSLTNGISQKARTFNGSSDNITVPDSNSLDVNSNTISAWVKLNSNSSDMVVVSKSVSSPSLDLAFNLYYAGSSTKDFQFYVSNTGSSWAAWRQSSLTNPVVGQWYHIVGVYTAGSGLDIYINGTLSNGTLNGTIPASLRVNAAGVGIGSNYQGGSYFNGSIDEVKIDKVARTADEIAEAYRLGNNRRFHNSLTTTVDLSNKSLVPVSIASGQPGTHLSVTFGESEFANYMPDTNTIGLWHLEENSGSSAYLKDSSIYFNHATPASGTSVASGYIGLSRSFNGSSDYLSLADNSQWDFGSSNFTIDYWEYRTSSSNDRAAIARDNNGYTPYLIGYQSGGNLLFYATSNGTSWDIANAQSMGPLETNKWNHYAISRSGTSINIYRNGQLINSITSSAAFLDVSSVLQIGRYATSYYFAGMLDEIRVSNTARTADEIRQAYEVGLRTHPVTIDFAASLDSGNLISGSGDTSFTIDATARGFGSKGSNLNVGDKIIVRENYDGTEYIAQGTVTAVNISTGAVTISAWDSGGTFPSGGYTANADVFKWQTEYVDISDALDSQIDAVDNITWRVLDGDRGRSFWIDDLKMVGNYLTTPTGSTITSTPQQYFQYRIIETTTDTDPTPAVSSVSLNYSYSLSMTGGSTSQSYLANNNKNAFNVQCNGVTIAQSGQTIYCEGSWNQTNWYTVGSASSPLSNATIQGTPDVTTWTGYPADGNVTLYVRATVNSNPTSTYNFSVTKDTTPPTVTAITSVAGDLSAPYYDTTNDSSTLVVYTASADTSTCKWDETDITYTAMANSCTNTTNCTLDLSGLGAKTVYMACSDNAGNYTNPASNYQLDYNIGGISMTGASSSMTAINNYNKTAYNIQCNGVTKPDSGTANCYASFDQSDWHLINSASTPLSNATIQDSEDVTSWTGYNPDGAKTIYAYVSDTTVDSAIYSFASHVDTVYPVINSITSVAGDTTVPYEDASNNASTFVVFDASADSDSCKWSTNASHDYDTMPNSCGAAGNSCNLTLTGVTTHTAYIRCIDTHGNKQQTSLQVDYAIISEAPIESGWLYYRYVTINPATTLTNYQVKIELNTTNFDYANAQPDGDDIRFFDLLGETKYDYWIETWNPNGISEIWVEIPVIGTNTFLMEYGNSSAISESSYDDVFIKDYSYESDLSGQWLLDEGTGTTTTDSSGQGNDGTRQGSTFWRDSEGGQWDSRTDIKFSTGKHIYSDGADGNSRIAVPDSPELDLTTGASVEMWFKPHAIDFGTRFTRLLAKGIEGATMYSIILDTDNKPYFYLIGPNNSASSNTTLTTAIWYHLVGTYDGTNIKFYLNNELKSTTNAPGVISTNNDTFTIGNNSAGSTNRPAFGYFEDVRVYNRALSAGEVTAHYEHRKYDSNNPQTTVGGVRTGTIDETGQDNWYDPAWGHRTELTIINEGNNYSLTDYQVQFNIDTKIYIDQSQMQADGDDIRFTDSDGTTLLPYYIISGINTNHTRLYVKIPSISANNNKAIYMYYGNSGATPYQNFDNTFTKNPNITGVISSWHFDEGADNSCSGGQDACDSYGTNHGTFEGAPVWQGAEGSFWADRSDLKFSTGSHLYFDGVDDRVNLAYSSTLQPTTNHLTISTWINPTSDSQVMPIIAQKNYTGYNFNFSLTSDKKLNFYYGAYNPFGVIHINVPSSVVISPNVWTHVSIVYNSTTVKFYKNGQLAETVNLTPGYLGYYQTLTNHIASDGNTSYFKGYIDQLEIHSEDLNSTQVLALYERRRGVPVEPQAGYFRPGFLEKAGEIYSETWETGQTYYVSGPLTVASGQTLTIEPGTVIKFDTDGYITANSSSIIAEGTAGNPIYFTSKDDDTIGLTVTGSDGVPVNGDYHGIYVYGAGASGSFKFCNFNYGGAQLVLDGTTFKGMLNTKQVDITAYNNVFNNSANADIFVYQASPDIQRNNLGDSPYGLYIDAAGAIIDTPIQYNSFANTTIAGLFIDNLPDSDNNTGPGLTLRHNDFDNTNTGFYIDNPSGSTIRDSNSENTVDARQNAFLNTAGYMCYFDVSAGNCKFDRTAGGEILYDTNSVILNTPNGGQSYFAGSTQNAAWSFNNGTTNGDHLDIYLSTNSGAEFDQTITANIKCDGSGAGPGCSGTSGSVNWAVPAVSATEARLKVSLKDSSNNVLVEDISDQNFSITVIEDTLTDYSPDAFATHTLKFVVGQNRGTYIDDSVKITFPTEFDLSVTAADVSISGGDVSWSTSEIISGQTVTFPFTGTLDYNDGLITITIGNGANQVNNPTDEGSYTVVLTIHSGQAGGGAALERMGANVLIAGGLGFNINVESALEFSIRNDADTADINTLNFGDLEVNTIYNQSHKLKVTTNAYHGYTITAHEETDLTGTSQGIPDFTGTNADPLAWTAPTGTGFYGYHTSDATLGTGTTGRFATANRWAAMTQIPQEIAFSNTLIQNDTTTMTYRLQVNSGQPSGSYSHTVLYVCTAKY